MDILLSLNNNFFKNISPTNLIKFVKKQDTSNKIKGFEICATSFLDKIYLKKLARLCYKNNYILKIHCPSFNNTKSYINYINFISKVSKIYDNTIHIVIHSLYDIDISKSINKTNELLKKLFVYIDKTKIQLSIENLNILNNQIRLKKSNLINILSENSDLNFTYDIGHELIDDILDPNLDELLLNRLSNIHIHTFKNSEDHYPILDKDINFIKIYDAISTLKKLGYNSTVVTEYAIDYIPGKNFNEKFKNYIKYSIYLSDIIN